MRVVCPACGAMNSLESLQTDADARLFMAALTRMPGALVPLAPRYIALFRPQTGRALQWRKGTRLLDDLVALVQRGYVHRQGNVDRNCPVSVWGRAIEQIVNTPPARLPLKNHNYLAAIAWDLADDADKTRERAVDAAHKKEIRRDLTEPPRVGGHPAAPTAPRPLAPLMDMETMKLIRKKNMKKEKA